MPHNPVTHVNVREVVMLDEVTTNSISEHVDVDIRRYLTVLVQAQVGISAKVTIEGKLQAADNWIDVNGIINDDTIVRINTMPMMRVLANTVNGPLTVIFRFDKGR